MKRVRLLTTLLALICAAALQAQTLNVYAAASLKESATEIARSFEKINTGVKVSLNFAGSQQLAAQIQRGAPVDVLLSAGLAPLNSIIFDKTSLRFFAYNTLALVVPAGSNKIHQLKDLGSANSIVLADRHVPVGGYTEDMLTNAAKLYGPAWYKGFQKGVVSREQDVRAVLAKISLREADAGIVYATDAIVAKGKVRVIPITNQINVTAQYPAVRFAHSANAVLAKEFIRFLMDRQAQKILMKHGFGSPLLSNGAQK